MHQPVPLIELIQSRLESGDVELPVFDGVAIEVHRGARENQLDADGLCQILEKDATLVSEVLKMSNSSFFSGLGEVRSLQEAVVRLGIRQIAAIVFSVSQKRLYSASGRMFRSRLVTLWQHASAVSISARWTAIRAGHRGLADEAFVAGLLHDVGKLSLLRIIEDLSKKDNLDINDVVVDMTLDSLHCGHAARLLEMWNLPKTYRDVVARIEDEQICESDTVLAIVRFANAVCAVEELSDRPDPTLALETLPEVGILGINDIDIAELRLVVEDIKGGVIGEQQAA